MDSYLFCSTKIYKKTEMTICFVVSKPYILVFCYYIARIAL